ncbi:hypothetical protein HXX01_00280 [Candidatus Nomurabacteria bacterium]|nr:hypothetical protein [Candidatus Nomurabacteria bacterium]
MDSTILFSVIISVVGIGLTAYYAKHSKKIAHEQMLKQLFTEFNHRYDLLNTFLSRIEQECPTKEQFLKHEQAEMLRLKVVDYFCLCAEEFFWYQHKGRIDLIIWNSWQSGMNYWYRIPTIKYLWDEEVKSNGKSTYYITNSKEFFEG